MNGFTLKPGFAKSFTLKPGFAKSFTVKPSFSFIKLNCR